MKILAIGIDGTTREFLKQNGMLVAFEELVSTEELSDWAASGEYDLVVIDLDVAAWGSFGIRYLRNKKLDIPIVGILRGQHEKPWPEQRAAFLENGGDDLLRGPPNPRELVATLRAVTRRAKGLTLDIVEVTSGGAVVKVDLTLQAVYVNRINVHLTGKETTLMCMIASSKNRTLSKEVILANLYSVVEDEAEMKIIDVFVCKIRKKLADIHPDAGGVIETVWGRGYRLMSASGAAAAVA